MDKITVERLAETLAKTIADAISGIIPIEGNESPTEVPDPCPPPPPPHCQATVRFPGRVHFQVGTKYSYKKFDVQNLEAERAILLALNKRTRAGAKIETSLYDNSITPYVVTPIKDGKARLPGDVTVDVPDHLMS